MFLSRASKNNIETSKEKEPVLSLKVKETNE